MGKPYNKAIFHFVIRHPCLHDALHTCSLAIFNEHPVSWFSAYFSSCFLSDYPQCQRTLDNCGQDGSVPFVPDGREDHLLSLIVNCNVQEGGLLLVQDHIGIVAQEQGDGFGMALPRREVKRGVLSEKTEPRQSSDKGYSSFGYFTALFHC